MTLQSSGAISLSQVNTELGLSSTTNIALNNEAVRTLLGIPSGSISLSNAYGKSNAPALWIGTISIHQLNLNLRTWALANGWNGTSAAEITINPGIYIWSNSTATPGLTTDVNWPGGLKIINKGYIIGMGGDGGYGGAGAAGGPAISLGIAVTIDNTYAGAYIAGGGGGGASDITGTGYNGWMTGGGGGAGGGSGAKSYLDAVQGSATPGGAIGAIGSNAIIIGTISYTAKGGGAGGGGGGINAGDKTVYGVSGGAGGGRILPGIGGAGAGATPKGGGSANSAGAGGIPNTGGCGGGGWGASGGTLTNVYAGGAGGKAVSLNGKTVTWVSGNTTRVYGAVS